MGDLIAIQIFLETLSLFQGIKIRSMDVFHQGGFHHFLVIELHHMDWNITQAGCAGCTKPSFASNTTDNGHPPDEPPGAATPHDYEYFPQAKIVHQDQRIFLADWDWCQSSQPARN